LLFIRTQSQDREIEEMEGKNECIRHPSLAKDKEKTTRQVSVGHAVGLLYVQRTTNSEVL
jgi:hypothetical protein